MHELKRFLLISLISLTLSMSSAVWGGEVIKGSYSDGITLTITIDPFDSKSHAMKKCGDYIYLIDGKPFYGSDGTMPEHVVSRLVFEKKGKQTALDVSSMYDPIINNENMKMSLSVLPYWGDAYKVTGYFSDGAGAYVCQWLVMSDGAIRTHISNFEELIDLTSKVQKDFKH